MIPCSSAARQLGQTCASQTHVRFTPASRRGECRDVVQHRAKNQTHVPQHHRSSITSLACVREVCVAPDVPAVFLIDLDAQVASLAAWRATSLAMEA
jgi:hypothetical protein